MQNPTFKQRLTWHKIQLSGLQAVISSFFFFSRSNSFLSLSNHFINRLVSRLSDMVGISKGKQ